MLKICIKRDDGGCTIRSLQEEDRMPGETDDEFAARSLSIHPRADAVSTRMITVADVPKDREFRDAWEDDGAKIDVNLAKAKTIQTQRVEEAKGREAFKLSVREMKGENVQPEKVALQAIDATPAISAASDVAQLKAAWPPGLPK